MIEDIFDEMKYIDWVLDWCHLFFIFKSLNMVFRWHQSLGTKLGFVESVQNRHLAEDFGKLYVQFGGKLECTDNF